MNCEKCDELEKRIAALEDLVDDIFKGRANCKCEFGLSRCLECRISEVESDVRDLVGDGR